MYTITEVEDLTIVSHNNKVLCFDNNLFAYLLEKKSDDLFSLHHIEMTKQFAQELKFFDTTTCKADGQLFMEYLELQLANNEQLSDIEPISGSNDYILNYLGFDLDSQPIYSIYDEEDDENDVETYLPETLLALNVQNLNIWFAN